jgi:hypothetical protein
VFDTRYFRTFTGWPRLHDLEKLTPRPSPHGMQACCLIVVHSGSKAHVIAEYQHPTMMIDDATFYFSMCIGTLLLRRNLVFGSKPPHGTAPGREKHASYKPTCTLTHILGKQVRHRPQIRTCQPHGQRSRTPCSACDHFINLLKTLPISFALFFG